MDRIVVLLNKRSAYVSQKYYFLTLVHGIPEGMLQRASLRVHPKSRFTYDAIETVIYSQPKC